MSKDDQDDRELEAYLKGDSALSKAYEALAREEPSARLDRAIVAEARRALSRRRAYHPFASHWMVPASLAAVLLIGIGLVTLIPHESDVFAPKALSPESEPVSPEGEVSRSANEVKSNAEADTARQRRSDVLRDRAGAGEQAPERRAGPGAPEVKPGQQSSPERAATQKRRASQVESEAAPALLDEYAADKTFIRASLADKIRSIRIGMSQAEVRRLLGEPMKQDNRVWTYQDVKGDNMDAPMAVYRVYFEQDRVQRIEDAQAVDADGPNR